MLVVGRLDGLELGRSYLPIVLFRESAPSDCNTTTGIDERWYGPSAVFDDNAYRLGVLANRADSATMEFSFLSVGELRAGPEPVSGVSASQQVPFLGGINSVGRCPVAAVFARGRALSRARAVAVELFASVR